MTAEEVIIELLQALQSGMGSDPFDFEVRAIENAEDYLDSHGYRRDGLTGETWLKK